MNTFCKTMAQVSGSLLLSLVLMASANAAIVQYTFDFTGGSDSNPDQVGNVIGYSDDGTPVDTTITATVTAWADLGTGTFTSAAGYDTTGGQGLAVCNTDEGTGGSIGSCTSRANRRSMDNTGGIDYVMIQFSETVRLDSFIVTPDGNRGRDVSYFTGWLASGIDLTGMSYADLTGPNWMREFDVNNGRSTAPATVDIFAAAGNTEVWGDTIIIGTSKINGGDRFYLTSLTTTVPLPAGVWLMLSALGALVARARLKNA